MYVSYSTKAVSLAYSAGRTSSSSSIFRTRKRRILLLIKAVRDIPALIKAVQHCKSSDITLRTVNQKPGTGQEKSTGHSDPRQETMTGHPHSLQSLISHLTLASKRGLIGYSEWSLPWDSSSKRVSSLSPVLVYGFCTGISVRQAHQLLETTHLPCSSQALSSCVAVCGPAQL